MSPALRTLVLLSVLAAGCEDDVVPEVPEAPATPEVAASPEPPVAPAAPTPVTIPVDGGSLAGELRAGTERDAPLVVLFHRVGADRTEWSPLFEALRAEGVGVLAVDLRGHGASVGGPVGWREFAADDWPGVVNDGVAVLEWIAAREPRPRAVILGGSSIGSTVALVHGARSDVDAVFALSPGRAYHGIDALSPLAEYGDRPLLLIASAGDIPSAEVARDMARVAPAGEARLAEGEDHGGAMLQSQPGLVAVVADFVGGVSGANE